MRKAISFVKFTTIICVNIFFIFHIFIRFNYFFFDIF